MSLSIISSIFVTALGCIYTFCALTLPPAAIGRPNEPKIFPTMLGVALLGMGIALLIEEIYKIPKRKEDRKAQKIKIGTSEKQIALTLLNGLLYALLFNPIGYVFSTIIFLMVELFIFDGFKVWKKALAVALSFTISAYCIFDILLGIYLPKSLIGIF
jgi:putative tricarboxylic transport membrane protein